MPVIVVVVGSSGTVRTLLRLSQFVNEKGEQRDLAFLFVRQAFDNQVSDGWLQDGAWKSR
jgi:hypothetical protein